MKAAWTDTTMLAKNCKERSVTFRRDRNAFIWFSRKTGNKIRFSIGNYNKSRVPELVDVKITDQCHFGCAFCYQGSGPQGKNALLGSLGAIARYLGEAGVFEVALGGGEPFEHPDIVDICWIFRYHGVVPNITTRRPDYLAAYWPRIKDYIG